MIEVKALTDKEIIENVISIVKKNIPDCQLFLFGSRAKGTHKESSDFDIAIKNNKNSIQEFTKIRDLIEELDTLKKIDLIEYNDLGEEFKKIVDSQGVLIYERKK